MNILPDTDIPIDVAMKREPFYTYSATVLNAAERKELLEFVQVGPTETNVAEWATSIELPDFEDALQVAAASACHAQKIITRNIKRYKKSPIKAVTAEDFLNLTTHI